jgi:hypothetical protein
VTIALLIAAWFCGIALVVAVCRAAAAGDRALVTQTPEHSPSVEVHEHPLLA